MIGRVTSRWCKAMQQSRTHQVQPCVDHTPARLAVQHGHGLAMASGTDHHGIAAAGYICRPLLLVSDLDDTLIGCTPADDAATAAFKAVWERSKESGSRCVLAVNTGRTLPLWQAAWQAKQSVLPQPDLLVAGVGTRVYHYHSSTGDWVEDAGWTARMGEGWDIAAARGMIDSLITSFGPDSVEYRPAEEMHSHKLTVLYRRALREVLLPQLHLMLQQQGLQATVIEGGSGKGPDWQFIDLLPQGAGKGAAMRYIQQSLGFDDASLVAAGDANNDLLMLQQAPQAIVVGNAVGELKAWAQHKVQQRAQQQQAGEVPAGVSQQVVYMAHAPVAAGVLEGLEALGVMSSELPN